MIMSKCRHLFGDICKKDAYPCAYSEACFEPEELKPKTNADHIRSMTDEELALALKILAKNDVCLNPNNDGCDDCADCVFHQFCKSVRCEEDVEYWLKQPYGGDT